MKKKRLVLIVVLILSLVMIVFLLNYQKNTKRADQGATKTVPVKKNLERKNEIQVIAKNLKVPWEIVFLPDKTIFVTERPGTVKLLTKGISNQYQIDEVYHYGEGGLLGAAIHPDFEKNHFVYLYLTYKKDGKIFNKVNRYQLKNNQLTFDKVIIDGIKGSIYHDGGRIKFGPDGFLYITTGDALESKSAQAKDNLNGKILRVSDEGEVAGDNPFANPVYSFGHRNPQGLAWDKDNQLWVTEHGPSGPQSGFDEINRIEKGSNYGWPEILGDEGKPGMIKPWMHSGASEIWAPAGATFYKDWLLFTGLRGAALYKADLKNKVIKKYFSGVFGRLRTVVVGPDGYLYLATSNTDGRGNPKEGDDKIIRINPKMIEE